MKKQALTILCGISLLTGLYAQQRLAAPNNPSAMVRGGQSEIIFNASASEKDIAVWINGVIAAHVFPKSVEKIIVSNGRNVIEAAETTARGGQWNIGSKKQIAVDCSSNSITINPTTRYGALINLAQGPTMPLGSIAGTGGGATSRGPAPASQPASRPSGSIEGAVSRVAANLISDLAAGLTLAVISISSSDAELSDFAIEELTFLLVDARKYKVADRKSLEILMQERKFQYSGEVDDKTAVSIGKIAGASIVITGSIGGSGSTRRLTVKALDVQSAEIKAMTRESF